MESARPLLTVYTGGSALCRAAYRGGFAEPQAGNPDRCMEPQIEITALRVLCLGTPEGSVKTVGKSLLGAYRWSSPLHQAIWDSLYSISSESPEVLRQLLPAGLTRLGFPDVEWEGFFAPHSLSKAAAIALMRRMAGGE